MLNEIDLAINVLQNKEEREKYKRLACNQRVGVCFFFEFVQEQLRELPNSVQRAAMKKRQSDGRLSYLQQHLKEKTGQYEIQTIANSNSKLDREKEGRRFGYGLLQQKLLLAFELNRLRVQYEHENMRMLNDVVMI